MLEFFSASTRMANPEHAIDECVNTALDSATAQCDLIIVHASIGHDLLKLNKAASSRCPYATVVSGSCAGIVGREGASESMKDVAIMAVKGNEFSVAKRDEVTGLNSYEKARELGLDLHQKNSNINILFVLASGIDISNDRIIEGLESVFSDEITIIGASTSDRMKGITNQQALNEQVSENSLIVIGFSDPSLQVETQATHGFVAVDDAMTVTESRDNRIVKLDNKNAWQTYLEALGLPSCATTGDTIPIGALAVELPYDDAENYRNPHILRVITHVDNDGSMVFPVNCPVGTKVWLTERDEEKIFSDMDKMTAEMVQKRPDKKPIAVFQADCLARGRALFNRIMKDELVQRMQYPFCGNGDIPPWLGIYGFGEFARLNGKNIFHNYTTSLAVLYRQN